MGIFSNLLTDSSSFLFFSYYLDTEPTSTMSLWQSSDRLFVSSIHIFQFVVLYTLEWLLVISFLSYHLAWKRKPRESTRSTTTMATFYRIIKLMMMTALLPRKKEGVSQECFRFCRRRRRDVGLSLQRNTIATTSQRFQVELRYIYCT